MPVVPSAQRTSPTSTLIALLRLSGMWAIAARIGFWLALSGCLPAYATLSNPNADASAKTVMAFLNSIDGSFILAGQQENYTSTTAQMERIKRVTGKLPAVRGFDLREDAINPVDEARRAWYAHGQIVSMSWHAGAPPLPDSYDNSIKSVDGGIAAVLTPGTDQNLAFMQRLDAVADKLTILRRAGVPVLWRPFHEMTGDWFWWSKSGPAEFIRLWRFTHAYLTKEKQLHNLIWVWSTARVADPAWYPGDDVVDIGGCDTYLAPTSGNDMQPWAESVAALRTTLRSLKPMALTENDIIPHPTKLFEAGYNFIWFLTWRDQWLSTNGDPHLKMVYNHEFVLTADELPNLRAGEIRRRTRRF